MYRACATLCYLCSPKPGPLLTSRAFATLCLCYLSPSKPTKHNCPLLTCTELVLLCVTCVHQNLVHCLPVELLLLCVCVTLAHLSQPGTFVPCLHVQSLCYFVPPIPPSTIVHHLLSAACSKNHREYTLCRGQFCQVNRLF